MVIIILVMDDFRLCRVNSNKHKANLNLYITSEVFSESVKISLVIKLKYSKVRFLITK